MNKNTKCRFVIACMDSEAESIVTDFWAFTQQQADYRLRQQQALLPRSVFSLFAYCSLPGWVGDTLGQPVILSGSLRIDHPAVSATNTAEIITGGRLFVDTNAHLSDKYDLTFVLDQDGQKAVAFDGVLWKRGTKARDVLAQVGKEIDSVRL